MSDVPRRRTPRCADGHRSVIVVDTERTAAGSVTCTIPGPVRLPREV
ncbi:hypothetical protein ACFPM0_05070 [Pseudonocardia sulfidoxydans]